MRITSIMAAGLFCLFVRPAVSQIFEEQVSRVSQKTSAAALEMRRKLALSGLQQQSGSTTLNPADALDEAKVGIAAKFLPIPPGEFYMGSPSDEPGRLREEVRHRVKLTGGFEMQATAVTQLQYFLVTGRKSSFNREEDCDKDNFRVLNGQNLCINHPAEFVSWDQAQSFIADLNKIQD